MHFLTLQLFSWVQWPDCMDVSRWIFYGLIFEVCLLRSMENWYYMNCNAARKRSVLCNHKELAKISRSSILRFLSYLIWVELEKKTMNIAQRSYFDISCRSVHVNKLRSLIWADNELNVTFLVTATRFFKLLRQRYASGRNEPICAKTFLTMGHGYCIQKWKFLATELSITFLQLRS